MPRIESSTPRTGQWLASLALVALLLVPLASISRVLPAAALAIALAVIWSGRQSAAWPETRLALFVAVFAVCSLTGIPYAIWIGVIVLFGAARLWTALAPPGGWVPGGERTRPAILFSGLIVVVAGVALTLWAATADSFADATEDLADAAADLPIAVLAVGAVGFVVINAVAEEIAYRGVAYEVAAGAFRTVPAIAIQGVAFGLAHIEGFPAGTTGVVLATLYGLSLGVVRHMTGGLRLPILVHIAADATIAVLFFTIVL